MSVPDDGKEALSDLIARCIKGDQSAYAALYDQYAAGLYRLAYSILLDVKDAEDVLQEAFIYAFRNLHRYDAGRGEFRTWLYMITVSRCRNMRRRKLLPSIDLGTLLSIGQDPPGPPHERPEAVLARHTVQEALQEALATLSPRLREAVALRYGHGLTYREMAVILDCPQKTAESRVRLAHGALEKALGASGEFLLEEMWSFS